MNSRTYLKDILNWTISTEG